MWYFENSIGVVCKVPPRSSSHEGLDFVCFPQRKYTDCGSCVYDKKTSADWFYEAFNNSPATESGMLRPGCIFVGIGHFDDSSNTDCLKKNSEHPFLQTILNLTLEIIILVRIFECRIQILRAFVVQCQATQGQIITIWLVIWLRLFEITHLKIR